MIPICILLFFKLSIVCNISHTARNMNCGMIAVFGVPIILMTTILFTSTHRLFTGGYEKSQVISQGNGCGDYLVSSKSNLL